VSAKVLVRGLTVQAEIGVYAHERGRRQPLVIDVDPEGLAWLAANEHRIPTTRRHETRRGGQHLLFRYPMAEVRNSAGRVSLGVDVRGEGGYVIAPPSPGYAVLEPAMPAEAPAWLIAACSPPPVVVQPAAPYAGRTEPVSDRYAAAALDGECRAVAGMREGGRNDRLNVAAVKLGSLVGAGLLQAETVRAELTAAAMACGLDPVETRKTIASGMTFGIANPRQVPKREPPVRLGMWGEQLGESVPQPAAEVPPNLSAEAPKPPLPLVYFDDVAPNLDCSDFVEGLLTEGAMSVVYGPSNCGKTFFMSDLALHIAAGWEWRGRGIEAGGVIYCALEGSHGISNRVAAFKAHHGILGGLPFAVVPVAINLLDPNADRQKLIDTVRVAAAKMGCPVKLVVIDTLSRAMAGGNENAPDDMGALVASADDVRQATGAHVAFIHHSGKDQAAGARGHSLLRAATDTEIEIGRENNDAPSVARVTKQREMEIEGEFVFTLKVVELGTNRRGKAVTSCVVEAVEGAAPAKQVRLSGGAQAALKALTETLAKAGQSVGMRDIPENVPVVPVEAWRREFYARSTLDSQEARKKAFQRGVKDLMDAGSAAVMHDRAWILSK
jgi:hypothetical protein